MNVNAIRSEINAKGNVELTHPTLGRIATLERYDGERHGMCPAIQTQKLSRDGWFVAPYAFPIYERAAVFHSGHAAEAYAVALANEMVELGLPKSRPGA